MLSVARPSFVPSPIAISFFVPKLRVGRIRPVTTTTTERLQSCETRARLDVDDNLPSAPLPSFYDGVQWYSLTTLGSLVLSDVILPSITDSVSVWLSVLGQVILVLVPTISYAQKNEMDLKRCFRVRKASFFHMVAAILLGSSLWIVVASFLQTFRTDPIALQQASDLGGKELQSLGGWLLLFTGGVAPFVEEILFRGYLLTALRRRLGSIDAAAINGVLFGLIHLSSASIFPLSILGSVLSLVAMRTGSLLPCIVLHAINNCSLVLFSNVLFPPSPNVTATALTACTVAGILLLQTPPVKDE